MDNHAPNARRIARLLAEVAGPPSTRGKVNESRHTPRQGTARVLGSVVTVLFVAVLTGVLWFRGDHRVLASQVGTVPGAVGGSTAATGERSSYLPQSGDPGASAVFASQPPITADAVPGAPAF
jgi:hypothetical protein